jgi:hypothetical protein
MKVFAVALILYLGAASALRVAPTKCGWPELHTNPSGRRLFLGGTAAAVAAAVAGPVAPALADNMPMAGLSAAQTALYGKPRMTYPDFTSTASGLQYKSARAGSGAVADAGDRVVLSWSGYTIGYYARPFELANSVKGGAFEGEPDSLRFVVGQHTVVPGLEEGIIGMRVGEVRQIVVPPELGYPEADKPHAKVGPKPSTFSGQRALDFVLFNQGLIDKTLLFNVELKRVDKIGERGFKGA